MSELNGAVLFDFDGTLVDSSVGILSSLQQVLPRYGVVRTDEELLREIGPPFQVTWKGYGFDDDQVASCLADYRAIYTNGPMYDVEIYDGIVDVIRELRSSGRKTAIATSKALPYTLQVVEHLGWLELFDVVSGATLDGSRSLKADIISHALEQLDTTAAVMIGDRDVDILGAHANEIHSVGVMWGFGDREELSAAKPTAIVNSTSELGALLA